jgi:hypothetical protein
MSYTVPNIQTALSPGQEADFGQRAVERGLADNKGRARYNLSSIFLDLEADQRAKQFLRQRRNALAQQQKSIPFRDAAQGNQAAAATDFEVNMMGARDTMYMDMLRKRLGLESDRFDFDSELATGASRDLVDRYRTNASQAGAWQIGGM